MLVTDYISTEFKPLQSNQLVKDALRLIDGYKLTHVSVFEGLQFLGNVTEESLEEVDENTPLIDCKYSFDHFFLTENSNLFDAINTFYAHNTNMIPVFNNEEHYMGFVLIEDIIASLSKMPFITETGAVMGVEIPQKQYSLSEIAKIVESNNNRLYGAIISKFSEGTVQVLIKLSTENLSSVSETFERFGYTVVFKFFNDEKQDLLKERFEHLQRYLNI